jgi:hypothetical protein
MRTAARIAADLPGPDRRSGLHLYSFSCLYFCFTFSLTAFVLVSQVNRLEFGSFKAQGAIKIIEIPPPIAVSHSFSAGGQYERIP